MNAFELWNGSVCLHSLIENISSLVWAMEIRRELSFIPKHWLQKKQVNPGLPSTLKAFGERTSHKPKLSWRLKSMPHLSLRLMRFLNLPGHPLCAKNSDILTSPHLPTKSGAASNTILTWDGGPASSCQRAHLGHCPRAVSDSCLNF